MLGNLGLHEQCAAIWLKSRRHKLCNREQGAAAKIGRFIIHGDCVQIDNTIESIVTFLEGDPLTHRSEVITKVK